MNNETNEITGYKRFFINNKHAFNLDISKEDLINRFSKEIKFILQDSNIVDFVQVNNIISCSFFDIKQDFSLIRQINKMNKTQKIKEFLNKIFSKNSTNSYEMKVHSSILKNDSTNEDLVVLSITINNLKELVDYYGQITVNSIKKILNIDCYVKNGILYINSEKSINEIKKQLNDLPNKTPYYLGIENQATDSCLIDHPDYSIIDRFFIIDNKIFLQLSLWAKIQLLDLANNSFNLILLEPVVINKKQLDNPIFIKECKTLSEAKTYIRNLYIRIYKPTYIASTKIYRWQFWLLIFLIILVILLYLMKRKKIL